MSNDACRGYVILAMRELGYKGEDIEKVVDALYGIFDLNSEEQAEQVYNDPFKYDTDKVRKQMKEFRESVDEDSI